MASDPQVTACERDRTYNVTLTCPGADIYVAGRTLGAFKGETLLGSADAFLARLFTRD